MVRVGSLGVCCMPSWLINTIVSPSSTFPTALVQMSGVVGSLASVQYLVIIFSSDRMHYYLSSNVPDLAWEQLSVQMRQMYQVLRGLTL